MYISYPYGGSSYGECESYATYGGKCIKMRSWIDSGRRYSSGRIGSRLVQCCNRNNGTVQARIIYVGYVINDSDQNILCGSKSKRYGLCVSY
jgi:hypothetical protein